MDKPESENALLPPYVTYKTFSNFIEGLREHPLPLQIDRSLMSTFSGSVQSSLLASLRALNLIGRDNKSTELFEQLHAAAPETSSYTEVLSSIIYKSYPFMSDGSIDIARATGKQLEDKFKDLGISGGTVPKAYSFFVSICKDAGLPISGHITSKKPSAPRKPLANGTGKKQKASSPPSGKSVNLVTPQPPTSTPTGTFTFEVPVYGKATARISLPKDMSQSEWVLIKTVIDAQAQHLLNLEGDE